MGFNSGFKGLNTKACLEHSIALCTVDYKCLLQDIGPLSSSLQRLVPKICRKRPSWRQDRDNGFSPSTL